MKREMNCRIGYTVFVLLEIMVLFVIVVARQIGDWWLFAAGVSGFGMVVRANYRFVRGHK